MTIARQPPSSLMTLGKNPNMSARGALYTTREA